MPNITSEQENSQMTPEQAKASMGLATRLMEQMMMQQNSPQTQETGPQGEEAQDMENIPNEEETVENEEIEATEENGENGEIMEKDEEKDNVGKLESRFSELEKEVKDTIKEELGGIKDMIKDALKNEDNG